MILQGHKGNSSVGNQHNSRTVIDQEITTLLTAEEVCGHI